MDRRRVLCSAALAALSPIGLLIGPALAQSEMVLKSADVHPFGYPTVEAVKWMGEQLERRPMVGSASRSFPRCSSAARRR